MFEISGCIAKIDRLAGRHFRVHRHELVLYGTCVECAASVRFGNGTRVRRLLPWTAGVLLGISVFWILPDIAHDRGWLVTLGIVVPLVLGLAWIDRYAYPICPFCLGNLHAQQTSHSHPFTRRVVACVL